MPESGVKPEISIAAGVPLSGKGAALGREMANAIRLAVDESGDGVGLLVGDDRGTEAGGIELARRFIADDSVVTVIGHYNSNATLAAEPLYRAAAMPLVAPIVSNPRLTGIGWTHVFRFTNSDDQTGRAIARHMHDALGKRRAAIVASDTVYGRSMADAFAAGFAAAGGSIGQRNDVAEGTQDFTALVAGLPRDIDAVFYGGTFEGAPLLTALRAAGRDELFATGDGCWDIGNFLAPAGQAATAGEGVLVLSACPEIGQVPGSREFAARYARRFGAIRNYAVNVFDAAALVLAAIRDARTRSAAIDRRSLLAALCATEYRGIAYPDPVRWDPHGENLAAVTALHTVRDGRFHQVALIKRAA